MLPKDVGAPPEVDAELRALMEDVDANLPELGKDKKVRDGDGWDMGSITTMHPGTPREATAVYCRLHGCKPPCRRTHNAPSTLDIRRWFARGLRELRPIPLDRAAHLRMYPR